MRLCAIVAQPPICGFAALGIFEADQDDEQEVAKPLTLPNPGIAVSGETAPWSWRCPYRSSMSYVLSRSSMPSELNFNRSTTKMDGMLVLGILVAIASAALGVLSMMVMLRSTPTARVSALTGNPPHMPKVALALRAAAGALAVLGSILASEAMGYWSPLLIIVAMGAPLAILAKHNRRLGAVSD